MDVEEATRHVIAVSNVPTIGPGNVEATSKHNLFLSMDLLSHLSNSNDLSRIFQAGVLGGLPLPRRVHGKKVRVIGYSAVGSTLCHYLLDLGSHVTAVRQRYCFPV